MAFSCVENACVSTQHETLTILMSWSKNQIYLFYFHPWWISSETAVLILPDSHPVDWVTGMCTSSNWENEPQAQIDSCLWTPSRYKLVHFLLIVPFISEPHQGTESLKVHLFCIVCVSTSKVEVCTVCQHLKNCCKASHPYRNTVWHLCSRDQPTTVGLFGCGLRDVVCMVLQTLIPWRYSFHKPQWKGHVFVTIYNVKKNWQIFKMLRESH